MNRHETKDAANVMLAWAEGTDTVQWRERHGPHKHTWIDCPPNASSGNMCWDWDRHEYRIKPKPKFRPMSTVEIAERLGFLVTHNRTGVTYVLNGVRYGGNVELVRGHCPSEKLILSQNDLLEKYKWLNDGNPAGISID